MPGVSKMEIRSVPCRAKYLSSCDHEKAGGKVKACKGQDPGKTAAFEAQASQAYEKVISLAADLNVNGESFTLRTSDGAMSFFNSSKVCVAVLHQAEFPPGIKERLLLVTRELSAMMD